MDNAETLIRALIQDRIEATRAKEAERATRHFADDVVIFDVVNPLRQEGIGAARKRADQWFSSFVGSISFDVADLRLAIANGVAFSYALNHVHGKTSSGNLDMWWRATTCYRNIYGVWKVTHEHNSVPFDPATGKASLELQP